MGDISSLNLKRAISVNEISKSVANFNRYKTDWKLEEAKKNILRTHTTAVSTRMLYKLAQQVGMLHAARITGITSSLSEHIFCLHFLISDDLI